MLIWQGWGIAGLLPLLAWSFGVEGFESVFGKEWTLAHEGLADGTVFVVMGIVVWLLGRWLTRQPGRILLDPETNEQVMLKRKHTFFFIPLNYAGMLWVGVGVYCLLFR